MGSLFQRTSETNFPVAVSMLSQRLLHANPLQFLDAARRFWGSQRRKSWVHVKSQCSQI